MTINFLKVEIKNIKLISGGGNAIAMDPTCCLATVNYWTRELLSEGVSSLTSIFSTYTERLL